MHLIIFKTSVDTPIQAGRLKPLLNAMPPITECSFDLEDCDRILRIVTKDLQPQVICQLLETQGFNCEPMETFVYDL